MPTLWITNSGPSVAVARAVNLFLDAFLLHSLHKPVHALIDSFPVHRRAGDYAPIPILKLPELQCFRDVPRALRAWLILFICEHEKRCVSEFLLVEHVR